MSDGIRSAADSASAASADSASAASASAAAYSAYSASAAFTGAPEKTEAVFEMHLWPTEPIPDSLRGLWEAFEASSPGTPWAFWAEWYRGMLEGRPLDWELQRRVALIDPEEWEKGPKHVAELIEVIRRAPVDRDVVRTQVNRLVARVEAVELTADGLATLIDDTIHDFMCEAKANELPEDFAVLHRLPPLLRRISDQLAAKANPDRVARLEEEIAELHAEIAELNTALADAKAKTLTGALSKSFWDQAGKSLGDWKMWGAIIGGGYVLLGDGALAGGLNSLGERILDLFPRSGEAISPATPKPPGIIDI